MPMVDKMNLECLQILHTFGLVTMDISDKIYRGSPTSTVSTSTNSTSTIFSAIGIKLVLVEFLELAM